MYFRDDFQAEYSAEKRPFACLNDNYLGQIRDKTFPLLIKPVKLTGYWVRTVITFRLFIVNSR